MKNYIVNLIMFICLFAQISTSYGQNNNNCLDAYPFCTGTTYDFPACVNSGVGQSGPNYGCCLTTPNPAWYYMQIAYSGNLIIYIHSNPHVDIDFVCWGPFTSQNLPCTDLLTSNCSSCPNNTADSTFYPSGNMIDCSYSTSWEETAHINNAQTGQWYILLITNYSNCPCDIRFEQTNFGVGSATTNCSICAAPVSNNSPLCEGDTLKFYELYDRQDATYQWQGPNGFTSIERTPIIPSATINNSGIYSLTITTGNYTREPIYTNVIINPSFIINVQDTITSGNNYILPDSSVVNTSGLYYSYLQTNLGCDSLIVTTLYENPNSIFTFDSYNKLQLFYPNPTKNILQFETDKIKQLKIFNQIGELIFIQNGDNIKSIYLEQKGIFFLEINIENQILHKKVLVN